MAQEDRQSELRYLSEGPAAFASSSRSPLIRLLPFRFLSSDNAQKITARGVGGHRQAACFLEATAVLDSGRRGGSRPTGAMNQRRRW
jgi:hypothetical protein